MPKSRDSQTEYKQAPPHNLEAEQSLIGAVFLNNEAYWRVNDIIDADHFYEPIHQRIWSLICLQIEQQKIANPITLKSFFAEDEEVVPRRTVRAYLATLTANATSVMNARGYAEAIREQAQRRHLIAIAKDILDAAEDQTADYDALVEQIENSLYDRSKIESKIRAQTEDELSVAVVDQAATAYQTHGRLSGLEWGLKEVDRILGPMLPGNLIVLSGATSSGKTSFAHQVGRYNGFEIVKSGLAEQGFNVAYFQHEMTAVQMHARTLAHAAQVHANRIESGRFTEEEFARIVHAARGFEDSRFRIVMMPRPDLRTIKAHALRHKRLYGLDMLIIDHLRFIKWPDPRRGLVENVQQITAEMKGLAMELGIPVLLLAQLTRENQKRDDKRPNLGDLYGGSSIEQDADVVAFIHNESYWLQRSEPEVDTPEHLQWDRNVREAAGKSEIILGKRRQGQGADSCTVGFDAAYTRFYDYEPVANMQDYML